MRMKSKGIPYLTNHRIFLLWLECLDRVSTDNGQLRSDESFFFFFYRDSWVICDL